MFVHHQITETLRHICAILLPALFCLASGFMPISAPAASETLGTKATGAEVEHLSPALKTYICIDENAAPEWCKAYRAAKFGNSIAKWIKAREDAEKARLAKIAAIAKAKRDAEIAEEKRKEQAKKDAILAANNDPAAIARQAEAQAKEKSNKLSNDWTAFLAKADVANLTINQVMEIREFAETGELPEANEILGFAYSSEKGAVPVNLVEAYRQYAQAYVKGLKRVKPNMDRIWKKIPKEHQTVLSDEFK
jgi:hypothetical protein